MTYDMQRAMAKLNIKVMPFDNRKIKKARGYSRMRAVAVNPEEQWPELVTFHEMAHVILGHTTSPSFARLAARESFRNTMEAECHLAAMTAAAMARVDFDIPAEMEHLGGYTRGRKVPEESITRAAQVAVKIVEAGMKGEWHDHH